MNKLLESHLNNLSIMEASKGEFTQIVNKWGRENGHPNPTITQLVEKPWGAVLLVSVLTEQIMNQNYRNHVLLVKNNQITEVPFDKIPGKGWDFNKAFEYAKNRVRA